MPNRIIREAILQSEAICSLGWAEEVFFRRVMSIVDDHGRYEASPQLLRSRCYPLQVDSVSAQDVCQWLAACQRAGVIRVYKVGEKLYLLVEKFGQQQRTPSKYPDPPAIACNHLLAIDSKENQSLADASKCEQLPSNAHVGVFVFEGVFVDSGSKREQLPAAQDPPPPPPAPAAKKASPRGTRLPADWQPGPAELEFAASIGLANGKATAEAEKFRDYWHAKAGAAASKTDWLATWRNWCREAVARVGKQQTPAQGSTGRHYEVI